MVKGNKRFPVETIKLLSGTTVGYGSKDHSIFPFYALAACFYGDGLPVRLANNRYEQFQLGIKRHSVEMDVTIVADRKSGLFEILKVFYNFNGGGRANFSFSVAQVGATARTIDLLFPEIRHYDRRACNACGRGRVDARLWYPPGNEYYGADGR